MTNFLANAVAFTIGDFNVYWYGIIITAAILIATVFCMFETKRHKGNADYILTLFICVIPLAIIFARLAYVIFHPSDFFPVKSWGDFVEIFNIREGGISILGAIPGGILGAFINYKLVKKDKIPFGELLDILSPAMILGQALGRWGNFVNQELYGKPITDPNLQWFPFAVKIDNGIDQGWFQATFFYEMVLNLIGFAILLVIGRKVKKNLACLTFYMTWYFAVRSVMESLRADAVVSGGLHVGVLGCAIVSVLSFVVFILIVTGKLKTGTPAYAIEKPIEPEDE